MLKRQMLGAFLLIIYASTNVANAEQIFNVKDFGAHGDGTNLDTVAIQKAIDACHAANGGIVRIPAGTYLAGSLFLKSNIRIQLEENARLLGSTNFNDYILRPRGEFCYGTGSTWVFVHATNVENVTIEGNGTIDGASAGFNDPVTGLWQRGPLGVLFERSTNIIVKDITVTKIPGWSVTFFECEHVELHKVHILNVLADGINPVCCRHVLYDSVDIDGTGDDPITIKNEGPVQGPMLTSDIMISNCVVRNTRHPGLKIGTGTAGVFRNITVKDCTFDVSGSVFAIQLMRPSQEKDRSIENVELSNLTVKHARQLFDITTIGVERPVMRNLTFRDISYKGDERNGETSRILGTDHAPIENLVFSNITVSDHVKGDWLSLAHVKHARFSHIQLDLPRAKTALAAGDCQDLRSDNWGFTSFKGAGPVMKLTNMDGFYLSDSVCPTVSNFLYVSGEGARDITLHDVNTDAAEVPLVADASVPASGLSGLATGVQVTDFHGPQSVKPNEPVVLNATIAGATQSGPWRLRAMEGDTEVGTCWVWVSATKRSAVSMTARPFYEPGRHKLTLAKLTTDIEVAQAPAAFAYGEYAEIVSPPTNGAWTKVTATVKNIGGQAGVHVAELRADGQIIASQKLNLKPGEESQVTLTYCFSNNVARVLTLGDFPPWPFFTAANVDSRYFWGHHRLVIEAGGEQGHYDQYGAIYFRGVPGDFDAVAHVLNQSTTTGNNAAIGLIIRNRIDDYAATGFTTHLRVPIYGGYKIWCLDLNNDGVLETRADGGDGSLPCWYKYEKRGQQFRAYCSQDRQTWKPCGKWFTISSANPSQDVGIFGNASSGLGEKSRVEFSDFEVTPIAAHANGAANSQN